MELKLGYATPEAVRELFAEYTHMLVAHDPYFQVYLDLQHYDAEVADPTQKYGLPDGRLYVAWCDGQPAGCIALRRLDGTTCELKRLYVRPAFRGRGIAGAMMPAPSATRSCCSTRCRFSRARSGCTARSGFTTSRRTTTARWTRRSSCGWTCDFTQI